MRFPWEHDLRRTCDDCGEFWDVPYLLRRQKPEGWRKGMVRRSDMGTSARTDPWRGQRAALSAATARRAIAENERELIASLARCPSCLSTKFTDTRQAKEPSG